MTYWCPTCGMCWAASKPPLCKHGLPDGPPPRQMEPLPSWHPFAVKSA